jgi:succinyl-diaminopimelate desuccinylase
VAIRVQGRLGNVFIGGLVEMFEEFIERHRDDMVSTLQELLKIESVASGPVSDGYPFGKGPGQALEYVLSFAERHGFRTKNVDGYAGHVEYGEGDEYVAVLSHLDVVPAGSDWTFPPFAAEIHDGKIYARGAMDDKGPAWSTLWALIALKELGIHTRRKIRLIFGLDEESHWRCMEHYFQVEPKPLGGFTPDADFPLIHAEKGLCTIKFSTKADTESMCPMVIRLEGGTRPNVVPDFAYAVVDCHSETAAKEWEQKLAKDAKQRQIDMDVSVNGQYIQLKVYGVSAHASTPEQGVNAIVNLAWLLSQNSVSNASMWRVIAAQTTDGRGLGIDGADDITGALTCNLGIARLENNTYEFLFDIRYPIDLTKEELISKCQQYVSDKWQISLEESLDPLYVPLDSPVIRTLCKVYTECTGKSANPLAIGGATYARAIPNAVAFGPLFPGQQELAHQKDECWALNDFYKCVQIYAHAMMELANTL